jgi:hypothetical protein
MKPWPKRKRRIERLINYQPPRDICQSEQLDSLETSLLLLFEDFFLDLLSSFESLLSLWYRLSLCFLALFFSFFLSFFF